MKPDIKSQTLPEIQKLFASWQERPYRAEQLLDAIYRHGATGWDEITTLSKPLRQRLREQFTFHSLELVTRQGSSDTTQKFLWKLTDRALIESVLIPASPNLYGEATDRHTLCVSTQVGCAYGCRFCASGLDGWKRNLYPEEIVDQLMAVERWHRAAHPGTVQDGQPPGRLINNLVIMGMGEPLANYDHLLKALIVLNAPWGGQIGARKITISTSGLVPQIRRLADEAYQFRLAISLHGASDEVRGRIMPVNRKYPLKELASACEYYTSKKGRMITFEYILIAGVNDSLDQVQPLADLARQFDAKINLIPYNEVAGLPWKRPPEEVQEAFVAALVRRDVRATLRREKGRDIDAACGQLRLKVERASTKPPGRLGQSPQAAARN